MIDLGTGDGRYVLARAAASPESLVIGIDANAAAMAGASRRAARHPRRGGLPNARFVVAGAEALPDELTALADEVSVHFPWGSLLRGLVAPDALLAEPLARLLRPGGTVGLLVSVTDRDASGGIPPLDAGRVDALAVPYRRAGLELVAARPATSADVAESASSWGRRIGAGRARPAWRLLLRRLPAGTDRPTAEPILARP